MLDIAVSVIAMILINFSTIPQIRHNYKTKSTRDIAWWFLFTMIGGLVMWGVYGAVVADAMIFVNSVIGVGLWLTVLLQKKIYSVT